MAKEIKVTEDQLVDAFAEWDRQCKEDPDNFADTLTGKAYGQACASYLIKLLKG